MFKGVLVLNVALMIKWLLNKRGFELGERRGFPDSQSLVLKLLFMIVYSDISFLLFEF